MSFERKYGVEFEFSNISHLHMTQAMQAAGWSERGWGVKYEINDLVEVVSPILSGEDGIRQIHQVLQVCRTAGAKVNKFCGFHVHVDARDFEPVDFLTTARRFQRWEEQLIAFLPEWRKNSEWARSVNNVLSVLETRSLHGSSEQFVRNLDRNNRLNVAAFLAHGTIEFRQHQGTIDAVKAENWVRLCVLFMENCKAATTVTEQFVSVEEPTANRKNSLEVRLFRLLKQFDNSPYRHFTPETIANILGISAASVPAYMTKFRQKYPNAGVDRGHGGIYYVPAGAFARAMGLSRRVEMIENRETDVNPFSFLSPDAQAHFQERVMEVS